ncbi:MAG: ABC-F family ATP-binding cassette domain-containing protein [Bacteroidaceae bacterium]|nr:ABC-F family ATP-binding cassette domain-containing protein [Bacteroidaceae bacterium]
MNPNLEVQHLSKRIGDLVLLDDVSFSLHEGQRLGLIARNGTGKTTLLNILAGKEGYEEGSIVLRNGLTVGYLEQETHFPPHLSVREAVMAKVPADDDNAALRVEQILTKLGLRNLDQFVSNLSGGQQKRAALAAVLAQNPDILILDEPTNHLDIEMTEWLENYLGRLTGSLLLVTHDRYFLNRICTDILEIDGQRLYHYRGNYEYYLEKRQERLDATNANIERARNLYRTELEWMRRMPQARGHKARSRVEAFDDLERLAKTRQSEAAARLEMKATYIGSKIFEAAYVSKQFPDGPVILKDFYYNFSRYEKMGIVGPNGTGKSTFVKLLLGLVKPDSGRFVIGETVRFGYYSQEGMEFDEQMKVIDAVRRVAEVVDLGGGKRLTAMQFLTHFLFPPRRQQDYIYKLSGGERRRLYLCTVLMQQPNFLILDEPTNDLDIDTLQILEDYLAHFHGCVIVVSHDRYFTDKVVDHLLVFHGEGRVEDFPGNYTQFREAQKERAAEANKASAAASPTKRDWKSQSPQPEKKRRLSFKERQEYAALEEEIAALETEKAQIEADLCSGTLDAEAITAHARRLPELTARLDAASDRWLELAEFAE